MDINQSQKQTTFRHWLPHQNLRYYFFLVMTYVKNKLPKNKNKRGYFNEMSDFIGKKNKNKTQCRGHHQKKIKNVVKKMGNNTKIKPQIIILSQFYKSYYLQRRLGSKKMVEEIDHLLSRRIKKGGQFKQYYQSYKRNIEEMVQQVISEINLLLNDPQQDEKNEEESQTIQNLSLEQIKVQQNVESVEKIEEFQLNTVLLTYSNEIGIYLNESKMFEEDSFQQNWLSFSQIQGNNQISFDKFSKLCLNTIQYNVLGQ